MNDDLRTVIWKEWRSLVHGQNRRQLAITISMLAFWAVWLPVQTGSSWMTDGIISLLMSILMPVLIVAVTVPAAFAGERERKTLATLLATRLPDGAILFGKLIVPLAISWGALLVLLAISLVTANVVGWTGSPRFYDPVVIVPDLAIGFLVALLTASVGVRVSLRSRRTQDAQQMISLMLMLPAMGIGIVLFLVAQVTGGVPSLAAQIAGVSGWLVALLVVVALAAIDLALLLVARRAFRRNRLIALA